MKARKKLVCCILTCVLHEFVCFSEAAQVTVITQPVNTTVCEGGTAVFTCEMDILNVNVSLMDDVKWWRIRTDQNSGNIIVNTQALERFNITNSISQGTLTSALMITNVRSIDIGPYWCVLMINNESTMASNMAFLNITNAANCAASSSTDGGVTTTVSSTDVRVTTTVSFTMGTTTTTTTTTTDSTTSSMITTTNTTTTTTNIMPTVTVTNNNVTSTVRSEDSEIQMLFDQATNLSSPNNSINEADRIMQASDIATALVNNTQQPIDAKDVNLTVHIVSMLNNVAESAVGNLTVDSVFFEDMISVINNLLNETNRDSWEQLESTSPATSQSLVRDAERVTRLLSETLTNDTTEAIQTRENIVIKAERISYDDKEYTFPNEDDDFKLTNCTSRSAQVMVPIGLLRAIDAEEITFAITIIGSGDVLMLPSGTAVPQVLASPIFSLQVDPLPRDPNSLVDNPIMIMFDVEAPTALSEQSSVQNVQNYTIDDVSCNFYNYSLTTNLNQTGGWSTEGLTVDRSRSNETSVTCVTAHLTSFAVLVSMRSPSAADEALSVISYIGCAISLACLCLSIIFLSYVMYKVKDNVNHLFVHLNLCIALALGLVVFIAGIENATNNEAACTFVSALLQYLFISAFCWMLCEGVMLYMMLVTVFGNKLNKRCFFMFLGWGPAIPIVAISVGIAHRHYGTDHYCWIKSDDGAIFAFIVPIVTITLINCVFLAITLKVLWTNRRMKQIISNEVVSNKDIVKDLLKGVTFLLPLLGITWIIGILAVNEDTQVFAWIFAILNSLQGAFIFIFHVVRNKQVVKQVKEDYNVMRNSETLRRILSGSSGNTSTSDKTSQSALSKDSDHDKKTATTSFGNSTTCELEDYSSATKPRDKAGALGMDLLKKLDLAEEKDAAEENNSVKDSSHDVNNKEKSAKEEDKDFIELTDL